MARCLLAKLAADFKPLDIEIFLLRNIAQTHQRSDCYISVVALDHYLIGGSVPNASSFIGSMFQIHRQILCILYVAQSVATEQNTMGSIGRFHLSHIQVQLTLKYTRLNKMEPRYEDYLKSLIAPYHKYLRPNDLDINKVKRKYSAYPKIVNGRYLLHTVWRYHQAKGTVSMQSMGYISICPHRRGPSLTGTLTEFYASRMSLDTQAETDGAVNNDPRNGLDDFGGEDTAFSPEWSALVLKLRCVYYHFGSVRKLYNQRD
ncbi:hypothetical protein CFAM422_003822 [Trichoderma lentiforme]|uniref:Uncharacterized protein n=1 Tax=Trichoderma lentiforme TaxID=1567552 RepID=A0A9P4XL95_9HYPO|nr:hypothetical protein CFAM422_003822 [Trichoderma lentiforme]